MVLFIKNCSATGIFLNHILLRVLRMQILGAGLGCETLDRRFMDGWIFMMNNSVMILVSTISCSDF